MGSATSATTREFRTTGMVAVLVEIVYAALPGAPAGCWLAVRLVPAVPLVVVGLIIVALGAQTYLLDRQADEVDALRARIASGHAMPAVALAGEAARRRGRWTKLPLFGIFLGALAVSAALRSGGDCPAPAPTSGAAVGFALGAVVVTALGHRADRRAVAATAARVEGLRRQAGDGPSV